ncbi:MAG: sugar ABC transporter permease [Mycobacteriaceae bacterium]|nr:sugar ABC transporter permease [Mycobacteriaceae bacterium]
MQHDPAIQPRPARHRKPPRPRRTGEAGRLGLRTRRAWAGRLFIAPNLLAVAVFLVFPLAFSLYLSVHEWDMFRPARFVGADNYRRLLADDPLFWVALRNTALFTAITIVPTVAVSLACAAALNRTLKGIGVFRTLLFLPLVASAVAMALIWRFLFETENGLINLLLGRIGLGPVDWLTDPHWALLALCIVTIWKSVPFATVILLAAMQGVPDTLYEAARIDGAGALRRFTAITVPSIRSALSFVFVITVINSFQAFDQAYVLTGGTGGPDTGTYVFGIMLFQNAFGFYKIGYASALAWIVFAILFTLTLIQLRLSRREAELS